MRDIILGAAIGALIEFVAIAGLLRLAERVMPRLNPRTAEVIAGVLVVTVLGCIFFFGLPQLLSVEARLGAILLNLAFALWAMLVLHFALQSQANKKQIAGALTRFDLLDAHVSATTEKTFEFAKLTAETEALKLENKWMDKDLKTQQELHKQRMESLQRLDDLRQQLHDLNERIAVCATSDEDLQKIVSELLGAPSWDITQDGPVRKSHKYPSIEKISEAIESLDKRLSPDGLMREIMKKG